MKIGTISDLHIDRHPKLEPQAYLDALILWNKEILNYY